MERVQGALLRLDPSWGLWLMLALLVIAAAISMERVLFFARFGRERSALLRALDTHLVAGDRAAALAAMSKEGSASSVVIVEGLRAADRGAVAAEKVMSGASALQRQRLERGLAFLATLGNNAPFLGLLGTVLGVIHAFQALGAGGPGGGHNSPALMRGIAEALVTTAAGLCVAMPSVAAYNYFQRRIAGIQAQTEALSGILLSYLHDASGDGA